MSAVLVQIADAVVARLSATLAPLSTEGLPPLGRLGRYYGDVTDELEVVDELRIDVVPIGHPKTELAARGSLGYTTAVLIAFRYKFGDNDRERDGAIRQQAIDKLIELVETLHRSLVTHRLDPPIDAAWQRGAVTVAYDHADLRTLKQFNALLRVEYDVTAPLSA